MMVTVLSTSTWGDPNAAKRAILIHGLISCSQSWARVAKLLVEAGIELPSQFSSHNWSDNIKINVLGYYVVAPDLPGHGYASRPSTTEGKEYTVDKFATSLHALFAPSAAPVSLIIGHSLGSLVALSLLSLLPGHNTRCILIDAALEVTPDEIPGVRDEHVRAVTQVRTFEQTAAAYPLWGREDVIGKVNGELLCDAGVVNAIVDVSPLLYSRTLLSCPSHLTNLQTANDPLVIH